MQVIRGGPRKQIARKNTSTRVKYDPKDEATIEDVRIAAKKVARKTVPDEASTEEDEAPILEVPKYISVRNKQGLQSIVPGHVWRCSPFKWDPVTFAVESERLNERFIEPVTQNNSLLRFLTNPRARMVYGVSGNPDDSKAKLFAAFLVKAHVMHLGLKANVVWHTVYDGYENKILKEYDEVNGKASPTMLVLTNVTPNASSVRLGKVRDILERFPDIPRVVVCAGEDPLSFFATRLYYQINGLAYFSESLVKKRIEVI